MTELSPHQPVGSYPKPDISILKGRVINKIFVDSDEIMFHLQDGTKYRMYHEQDCCEHVFIEDINGDLDDLIGAPIVMAEVVCAKEPPPLNYTIDDTYTWTFYKLAAKGHVTIRWFGTSNGYYSEEVNFVRVE